MFRAPSAAKKLDGPAIFILPPCQDADVTSPSVRCLRRTFHYSTQHRAGSQEGDGDQQQFPPWPAKACRAHCHRPAVTAALSLRVAHRPAAADPPWMKTVIAGSASDLAISWYFPVSWHTGPHAADPPWMKRSGSPVPSCHTGRTADPPWMKLSSRGAAATCRSRAYFLVRSAKVSLRA